MKYEEVNQPEKIKGMKVWKNPKNRFAVAMLHYTADPNKDPERDGAEWYDNERRGTPKATWDKEYEIDFSTKSGKLIYGPEYCDFDKNIHLINSYELPEPYELLLSLDFGQRNPNCALVGAWTMDQKLYIIDEYYKPALPSRASKDMFEEFAYLMPPLEWKSVTQRRLIATNTFSPMVIDPSTKSKNRSKVTGGEEIPYSIKEEFYDHGWDFELAQNDIDAGITRIREYMKLGVDGTPSLYIFKDKCPNLVSELTNYRYKELTEANVRNYNDPEEPVKKNDHGPDSLRYMVMTRPISPEMVKPEQTRIQKDIQNLLRPKIQASDWDQD